MLPEPIVQIGDEVKVGRNRRLGFNGSGPVYRRLSSRAKAVFGGMVAPCIVIESDMQNIVSDQVPKGDISVLSAEDIKNIIKEAV